MYCLDEEKIDVHLASGMYGFWQGKKAENVVYFIFDVGIHEIYLSLTLGLPNKKKFIMFFDIIYYYIHVCNNK